LHSDIKGTELPPANILIPLERQLIALQLCRWQFLCNEPLLWHNTGVWQTDGWTDGWNCYTGSYYSTCNASIAARCKN